MTPKKIRGLHAYRFKGNPEEEKFALAWEQQNIHGKNLAHLLSSSVGRPPEPTDREHAVAATVVQWLGSPVGQSWLQGLGYVRANPSGSVPR